MYLNMFYYIMVPKGGSMNKAGLVFVGISIIIALAFMIPAFSMPGGSVDGAPGPGYFPIIVSVLVIIFAVIQGIVYIKDGTKTFDQTEKEQTDSDCYLYRDFGLYRLVFNNPFHPAHYRGHRVFQLAVRQKVDSEYCICRCVYHNSVLRFQ